MVSITCVYQICEKSTWSGKILEKWNDSYGIFLLASFLAVNASRHQHNEMVENQQFHLGQLFAIGCAVFFFSSFWLGMRCFFHKKLAWRLFQATLMF